MTDPVTPFYHLCSTPLVAGSRIRPGNWGRMVRSMAWSHPAALREAALECCRKQLHPTLPSRLDCAYVFLTIEEAQRFRGKIGDQAKTGFELHYLYLVSLADPHQPSFIADWRLVAPVPRVIGFERWPAVYWEGTDAIPGPGVVTSEAEGTLPHREMLTTSQLVIEGCLDRRE